MARKRTTKKKYKQVLVVGTDKKRDRARAAKDVGWRISDKTGRRYFENRSNRSDTEKEQKYHGGVNRRAIPSKRVKQTSTRASRSMKTTRRVAPVRKLDLQKRYLKIVTRIQSNDNYKGFKGGDLRYYKPTRKRALSWAELEQIMIAEMRIIDSKSLEHSFGLDKFGNILFRGVGNEGEAQIPSAIGWWRKHIGEDIIIVHNHPSRGPPEKGLDWYGVPTPLSAADVECTIYYPGCKGIVACCEGRYYACLVDKDSAKKLKIETIENWFEQNHEKIWGEVEYPRIERQKEGETRNDYLKRVYEAMHKYLLQIVKLMCKSQAKYLSKRGYKYITKRY